MMLIVRIQRLTVPVVDTFIQDLKESVREVKGKPAGKGTMVALYGAFSHVRDFRVLSSARLLDSSCANVQSRASSRLRIFVPCHPVSLPPWNYTSFFSLH